MMSKLKLIILGVVAFGLMNTLAYSQSACYIIADKDQDQKITLEDAISWSETMPVVVTCDNDQMYTLYSFDISIFSRKPLMTKGFGTAIEGIPLMAIRGIEDAKAGDTVIMQNVICKSDGGADVSLPMISFELVESDSAEPVEVQEEVEKTELESEEEMKENMKEENDIE